MKYQRIILLLTGIFWLFGCGREGGTEHSGTPLAAPDFVQSADSERLLPTHEDLRGRSGASLESARTTAEKYLQTALQKAADPESRALLNRMASALGGARLDVPPAGHDLRTCVEDSAVLAFVNLLSPHTIHLCARATGASEKKLSQVLVHETAHVAGVHDECDATRIEVQVMRANSARLPFRNGYMKRCGIR